jgi:hypothetical protein
MPPGPNDVGYWDFQLREALQGVLGFGHEAGIRLIREALAERGIELATPSRVRASS